MKPQNVKNIPVELRQWKVHKHNGKAFYRIVRYNRKKFKRAKMEYKRWW